MARSTKMLTAERSLEQKSSIFRQLIPDLCSSHLSVFFIHCYISEILSLSYLKAVVLYCGHRRRWHWASRLHDCPLSATEHFPSPRHKHGTVCQPKWRHQIPCKPLQNQTKIAFILGLVSTFSKLLVFVKYLKCLGNVTFILGVVSIVFNLLVFVKCLKCLGIFSTLNLV